MPFNHNVKNEAVENMNTEDFTPYTMDELNAWIDEAETEEGGIPSEEVFAQIERELFALPL